MEIDTDALEFVWMTLRYGSALSGHVEPKPWHVEYISGVLYYYSFLSLKHFFRQDNSYASIFVFITIILVWAHDLPCLIGTLESTKGQKAVQIQMQVVYCRCSCSKVVGEHHSLAGDLYRKIFGHQRVCF